MCCVTCELEKAYPILCDHAVWVRCCGVACQLWLSVNLSRVVYFVYCNNLCSPLKLHLEKRNIDVPDTCHVSVGVRARLWMTTVNHDVKLGCDVCVFRTLPFFRLPFFRGSYC